MEQRLLQIYLLSHRYLTGRKTGIKQGFENESLTRPHAMWMPSHLASHCKHHYVRPTVVLEFHPQAQAACFILFEQSMLCIFSHNWLCIFHPEPPLNIDLHTAVHLPFQLYFGDTQANDFALATQVGGITPCLLCFLLPINFSWSFVPG